MFYFDVMLESEDQVLINKVIENATFQMCIEGGEAVIQDVEDYVDLLMTENYEPTPQFDEYMFESLSPYLEENAKYLGMFLFLFEGDDYKTEIEAAKAKGKAAFDANKSRLKTGRDAEIKTKVANDRADDFIRGSLNYMHPRQQKKRYFQRLRSDNLPEANQEKMKRIEAEDARKEQKKIETKANSNKVRFNKKLGLMQKVKNTFSKDKTAKGLGQSIMKGLNNAKRSLGNKMLKAGTAQAATAGSKAGGIAPTKAVMKGGLLGTVASVGKNMVGSANRSNSNLIRKNIGRNKKSELFRN